MVSHKHTLANIVIVCNECFIMSVQQCFHRLRAILQTKHLYMEGLVQSGVNLDIFYSQGVNSLKQASLHKTYLLSI